jgi:carbonic anhydrase/acetyltransferase-like protein (isoleucine patch superfamily)
MSTVLGRSRIGAGSIVGAGALVPEGLQVPARSMVLGVPARVRPLADGEHAGLAEFGARRYAELADRYAHALRPVTRAECAAAR